MAEVSLTLTTMRQQQLQCVTFDLPALHCIAAASTLPAAILILHQIQQFYHNAAIENNGGGVQQQTNFNHNMSHIEKRMAMFQ